MVGNKKDNPEQITTWQHYVPRMYLRNFGEIKKKKNKEIVLVSFYQFDKKLIVPHASTYDICAEDFFYDKDNHIEHMLSNMEGEWSSWIKKVIAEDVGEAEEQDMISSLKNFAVYQYSRTNGMLEHTREMSRELMFTLFNQEYPEYADYVDVVKETIAAHVDNEIQSDYHVLMAEELQKEIDDLAFKVVKNCTDLPFITSDVPVLVMNPLGRKQGGGLAQIGIVMIFPISDWRLIVIYDDKIYEHIPDELTDVQEVRKLNHFQVLSADKRIIARNEITLQDLVNDNELISLRNRIYSENVITNSTSVDHHGKLMAMKSRSIPYAKELMMLRLPKIFKKIPVESRDVFPRKYEKKYRDAIVMRASIIRSLYQKELGDKVTKYDAKMIQNGYRKLLEFYDAYWEVPMEERTKPQNVLQSDLRKMNYYKIDSIDGGELKALNKIKTYNDLSDIFS